MLSKVCSSCTYVFWVVGIGMGVRCKHPKNQQYIDYEIPANLPVIISSVPDNCEYYTNKCGCK